MTQFEKSAPGTILSPRGATRFGSFTLMYIGATVLMLVIAAIAIVLIEGAPSTAAPARSQVGEVVDGWMPAIAAANQAARLDEARRTQDGWSSALLKPEPAIQDGWSAYLLRPEHEVVDGWAARYLVNDD